MHADNIDGGLRDDQLLDIRPSTPSDGRRQPPSDSLSDNMLGDIKRASEISTQLGGFDKLGDALVFPVPRGEQVKRMVFGNRAELAVRNRMSSWKTFLTIYWIDDVTIARYHSQLVQQVGDILSTKFPDETTVPELCRMLSVIAAGNVPNGLSTIYMLPEPMILAIRAVFMLWKNQIEDLIIRYNATLPPSQRNDMRTLLGKWRELDRKYNINSSSVVLLFAFNPASPAEAYKLLNARKWTPSAPKFNWGSDRHATAFLAAVSAREFKYIGFCSRRPIYRLRELLKFPIAELVTAIHARGGTVPMEYEKILIKCREITGRRIRALPKLPTRPVIRAIKPGTSIQRLRALVEQHLELARHYVKYLSACEERYIDIAKIYIDIGHAIKRYCASA